MEMLNEKIAKRLLAWLMTLAMAVTLTPAAFMMRTAEAEARTTPQAPREAADKTTWDCVYFGSYPQTEIVDKASTSGTYGKDWEESGDYDVNASLYTQLQNATYDPKGDTTINGVKYRRMSRSDATYYSKSGSSGDFNWTSSPTYRYFRYDKIKWRVLEKAGGYAMLLADKALDDQSYDTSDTSITWERSTMRSWLNGYESSFNNYGRDYSQKNFIDTAFSTSEQKSIQTVTIDNDNNIRNGTAGGDPTSDRVFLLSEADVWNTDKAVAHGFVKAYDTDARQRRAKSTTYAKARGTWSEYGTGPEYDGNCYWWLRSPGLHTYDAALVLIRGNVFDIGDNVFDTINGVRPALYLNLSSSLWSNAGTVSSDGTTVNTSKLSLSSAVYKYGGKKVDVLTTAHSIEPGHEAFNIYCTANDKSQIKRYELYSGSNLVAKSTDGSFLALPASKFKEGEKISVRTVGTNNTVTNPLQLIIEKRKNNVLFPDTFNPLGKSMCFDVDEDFTKIGGDTFTLSGPDIPISVVKSDGKIKIGVNLAERTMSSWASEAVTSKKSDWQHLEDTTGASREKDTCIWQPKQIIENFKKDISDTKKSIADLKNLRNYTSGSNWKAKVPGAKGSVKLDVIGYLEGTWSDTPETVSGELVLVLTLSEKVQRQTVVTIVVVPVPITYEVKGTIKGQASGKLTYSFIEKDLSAEINAAISAALEPYGGVGYKDLLSGGVYGKAEVGTNINIYKANTDTGVKDVYFYGEAGVKGYFAKKEGKWTIVSMKDLKKTYPKYIDDKGHLKLWAREGDSLFKKVTSLFKSPQRLSAAGSFEEAMSDPVALAESFETDQSTEASIDRTPDADNVFAANVYGAAEPQLAKAGDDTVLIYVDNDSSRAEMNQTILMYSIYDEETGRFSNPQPVDDDGTADYKPFVYSDGSDIYVAYLDSSVTYNEGDDPEMTDYLAGFGVSAAKFENGAFTDLGNVSQAGGTCFMPQITKAGGKVIAAWSQNSDNAIFGLSENNSVCWSELDGSSWSTPKTLAAGKKGITSLAAGEIRGKAAVAFAEDKDNDLSTDQQTLQVYDLETGMSSSADTVAESLTFTRLPNAGSDSVLAYNRSGGIDYITDIGADAQTLLSEGAIDSASHFEVTDDRIYYAKTQDGTRNIGALIFDGEKWASGQLTAEADYIDSFSVADGMVTYLVSEAPEDMSEGFETASSIKFLESDERNDIALVNSDYEVAEVIAGGTIPVDFSLLNSGTKAIEKVDVSIKKKGDEEAQSSGEYAVTAAPGEGADISVPVALPQDMTGAVFEVTATAGRDDNPADNTYELDLSKTELAVEADYQAGEEKGILVTVKNLSPVPAAAGTVLRDADGKVLLDESAQIEGDSAEEYFVALNDSQIPAEGDTVMVAEVTTDSPEYFESNNDADVRVWKFEVGEEQVAEGGTESTSGTSADGSLSWSLGQDGSMTVTGDGILNEVIWPEEAGSRTTGLVLGNNITGLGGVVFEGTQQIGSVTIRNKNCQIAYIPEGVSILADYGSTAYEYALENGRNFTALDEETHDHLWDAGRVTKEATTDQNGEMTYTCQYCGAEMAESIHALGGHNYGDEYTNYKAPACTRTGSKTVHCIFCDYEEVVTLPATGHDWEAEMTVDGDASCEEEGQMSIHCRNCDEVKDVTVIAATGHDFRSWKTTRLAEFGDCGIEEGQCRNCGSGVERLIPAAEKVKLSYTSCTYSGKARKPAVTVVDEDGNTISADNYTLTYSSNVKAGTAKVKVTFNEKKYTGSKTVSFTIKPASITGKTMALKTTAYVYDGTLKKPVATVTGLVVGSDFKVTYSNNKLVGKANAKVTGIGNYTGSLTKTFKINPKGTALSSLSARSKAFTAKWKKQATQTSGYQIRYSTSSAMTSAKSVLVSGTSTVSKKITGLKAKKKYYVQIRTYKTVGGVKYYSSWSAKKYVKTK